MGDDEGEQPGCPHQHKATMAVSPPLRGHWLSCFLGSFIFFVSKAMGTPVLAVYFLLHTACGSLSR